MKTSLPNSHQPKSSSFRLMTASIRRWYLPQVVAHVRWSVEESQVEVVLTLDFRKTWHDHSDDRCSSAFVPSFPDLQVHSHAWYLGGSRPPAVVSQVKHEACD